MKSALFSSLLFLTICTIGFFSVPAYTYKPYNKPQKKVPKRDRMDLAWEQEFEMTRDPKTGTVPRERLLEAFAYKQQLLQGIMGKAAIAGVNWTERGPRNCGGRTRAILVDRNDATRKTIWAGSVAGGLWKTTDITQAQPNWVNQNDFFDNMAITSITQGISNPQVMYFATGEGNGNIDAVRGLGVWKSTNGGSTWTQLSATLNSNFYYCQRVFTYGNGDTVFVGTQTGLYRSVNGGTSFTKVLGSGISSAGGNEAEDIERAANGTLYATMSGSTSTSGTIHKSYNNGATWTTPLTINGISGREIEIAMSEVDTTVIWGIVERSSTIRAIIKSNNAGVSFDSTSAYPDDADGGIPSYDFSRGQAWYDLSIAVDPNNAQVCFVGGVDLFKTSNGGALWQQISHWYGGFGFQDVHADQHTAVFAPGNSSVIYFGNDGGIYQSTNATASTPTLTSKEFNYNTTQFYAADLHPNAGSNHFLAGAQDNGSHRFATAGINSTTEVTGGDGAFCHIDQNQPSYQFTSYVYNSYYRSTNGGSSFSSSGLTFGSSTGRFINPTDYDDSLNVMYAAYGNGTYLLWSNPQTGNTNRTITVTALNSSMVSAIKVSPNVTGRVYFGTGGGRVVRVDSAQMASGTVAGVHINSGSSMPSGYVNCIEVEPGNENHIVVVYSNYGVSNVWETRNGGTSWTAIDGNLPDMPVRWALLNPLRPYQVLIATELGVWSTDSMRGSSTNWQPSNSGLSNTRVDMLKMRRSDYLVIAATHGRGVFSTDVFTNAVSTPSADFYAAKTVGYPGNSIQFVSASTAATSYRWDFGDGSISTQQNPTKTYSNSGVYTVRLIINNGADTMIKTNYISIQPYRGIPYTAASGGNFDVNPNDFAQMTVSGTSFERGFSVITGKSGTYSGNYAWVTSLGSNYIDNTETHLYSPSFNCMVSGTYTLTFYTKYKTETSWDGFRVEYSTNHGSTWLPLGTSLATNWYDYANTSGGRPFPTNEAYFSNSTSMTSFQQRVFSTTAFAGNSTVCFRFVFKSDDAVTDAGIALDNFELNGPSNNPLPVKLGHFAARRNGEDVQVSWSTYAERNNKGFELYVSDGATGNWTLLTTLAGNNTAGTKQYTYMHKQAGKQSLAYYLKQTDLDGSTYSTPQVVVPPLPEAATSQALFYTIPQDNQQLRVMIGNNETMSQLWVYNQRGQLVKSIGPVQSSGMIDLSDLPAGIYYLHGLVSGQQQVSKVALYR